MTLTLRQPAPPAVPTVQVITTLGANTVTVPAGAKRLTGMLLAGGAGGASGRRGAAGTIRGGGGAGLGGPSVLIDLDATTLGATITVYIGAGGAGGAAPTTDSTDGNPGAIGEGTYLAGIIRAHPAMGLVAAGGTGTPVGSNPGTSAAGGAGLTGVAGVFGLISGSAGSNGTAVAGAASGLGVTAAASGAGGGGVNAANASLGGGYVTVPNNWPVDSPTGLTTGTVGGTSAGGDGVNGTTRPGGLAGPYVFGVPGSGGGGNASGGGGRGGDASAYGAGGGGAGGGTNGTTGGRGGNGSQGYAVLAWSY